MTHPGLVPPAFPVSHWGSKINPSSCCHCKCVDIWHLTFRKWNLKKTHPWKKHRVICLVPVPRGDENMSASFGSWVSSDNLVKPDIIGNSDAEICHDLHGHRQVRKQLFFHHEKMNCGLANLDSFVCVSLLFCVCHVSYYYYRMSKSGMTGIMVWSSDSFCWVSNDTAFVFVCVCMCAYMHVCIWLFGQLVLDVWYLWHLRQASACH